VKFGNLSNENYELHKSMSAFSENHFESKKALENIVNEYSEFKKNSY